MIRKEDFKVCSVCGEKKSIDEFGNDKNRKGGKKYTCIECEKSRLKKYYLKNKELVLSKCKKYREENIEKEKIRHIKYREENIEKEKIRERKYRANSKENRKKYVESEQYKISKANSNCKRRYIKIASSDGTIPIDIIYPLTKELQALLTGQKNKCNNCRCSLEDGKHLDHHYPIVRDIDAGHSIYNVVWLCPTCNMSKGSKMPTEPLTIRIA